MDQESTICRLSGLDLTELLSSFLDEKTDCSIRVHGGSMAPFVRDGDIVKISPVSGETVRWGDIVVIVSSRGASPLVHRVVGLRMKDSARELLIKGDRCVYNDGWISIDNMLGRVCEVNRNGRQVTLGMVQPGKWLAAVMSRSGLLPRLLSFGARITGRSLSRRAGVASRTAGLILLMVCRGLCVIGEDANIQEEEAVTAKGRVPLVVLKQATIEGQIFLITDKEGKQIPAKNIKVQVNSIDTEASLFKTTTDDEGKYTLPNFDVGKYQFVVGRLKLEIEVTEAQQAGKRMKRISKKIIVFIPEEMR